MTKIIGRLTKLPGSSWALQSAEIPSEAAAEASSRTGLQRFASIPPIKPKKLLLSGLHQEVQEHATPRNEISVPTKAKEISRGREGEREREDGGDPSSSKTLVTAAEKGTTLFYQYPSIDEENRPVMHAHRRCLLMAPSRHRHVSFLSTCGRSNHSRPFDTDA
ncbi:hypothetical protein GW17_00007707 [Ensete ventricosum]|uniref:Uncharacterized protein n=1 Tax=Ensete ventricosum TaxID=4639 RepID=A0A444FZ10_ENSVE|nr:hypothetical protein B296_00043594 [Ensete ventricosum]RWW27847.1 hypothetical protein GW17_00007707 [Ensete ventricosum]